MAPASFSISNAAPHGCGMQSPDKRCYGFLPLGMLCEFSPDEQPHRYRRVRMSPCGTQRQVPSSFSLPTAVRRTAAVFSPDGKLIASGGSEDGVHLWNAETGRSDAATQRSRRIDLVPGILSRRPPVLPRRAMMAPCGILDTSTGDELLTLTSENGFNWVDYRPDGQRLVTADVIWRCQDMGRRQWQSHCEACGPSGRRVFCRFQSGRQTGAHERLG